MDILRVFLANIKSHKGNFISIAILTFIITLALGATLSNNLNTEDREAKALEDINAGDLMVIINEVSVDDEMVESIEKTDGVSSVEIENTITSNLIINDVTKNSSTFFAPYSEKKCRLYNEDFTDIVEGFAEPAKGEIYVPYSFIDMYKCKLGDKAYLSNGSKKEEYIIKGFVEEPVMGSSMIGVKKAFMNEDDFNRLYADTPRTQEEFDSIKEEGVITAWDLLNVYQSKDSELTISEFKMNVNNNSSVVDFGLFSMEKVQSISYTLTTNYIVSGVLISVAVMLMVVIIIIMCHSIVSNIELDYVNLGVYKALGFGTGKLRYIIALQYICAELLGIILGLVACIPTIALLNKIFLPLTGLLPESMPRFGIILAAMAAIMVVTILFIIGSTRRIRKVTPLHAISGNREDVYFKNPLSIPIGKRFMSFRLCYRQISSNSKQYISAIVIVALLMFFMISTTALSASVRGNKVYDAFGQIYLDVATSHIQPEDEEEIDAIIEKEAGISEKFHYYTKYYTLDGMEYHGTAMDNKDVYRSIIEGRAPEYENEIVVTKMVADELKKEVGDTVMVAYKDEEQEYIITGLYQSTNDLGAAFSLTIDGANSLTHKPENASTCYVLKDVSHVADLVKKLNDTYNDTKGYEFEDNNSGEDGDFFSTVMTIIDSITASIYGITIAVAIIVIFILCNKLYYRENRDLGIYKSFGYTSRKLRVLFSIRFAIVAAIGCVIGIIVDLLFENMTMGFLLSNIGICKYEADFSAVSFLLPTITIVLLFVVISFLATWKVKRSDVRTQVME